MNSDTEWSVREKLALSSYVLQRGSQHWSGGVSRLLKSLGEPNRPADWFNSKNCALQYAALIETAETPRRKRSERSESSESQSGSNSPPTLSISDSIVRRLTQERIEEIRKQMRSERAKYKKLKATLQQVESGELDDKLDDMIAEIQRQKQEKIQEAKPDEPVIDQVQESEVTKQQSVDNVEMKEVNEEETSVEPPVEVQNQDTQKSEELPESTVTAMDTEDSEEKADVTPVAIITAPQENPSEVSQDTVKDPEVADEEVAPPPTNNDAPFESSDAKDLADTDDPEPVDWAKEPIELSDEEPAPEETSVAPPEESVKEEIETNAADDKPVDEAPAEDPVVSEPKLEEDIKNKEEEEKEKEEKKEEEEEKVASAPSTKPDKEAISEPLSSQNDEEQTEKKSTSEEATSSQQDDVLQTPSEKSESIPEKDLKEVEGSLAEDECDSNLSASVADESTYSEQGYAASMPSTPAYVDSFPSSPALSTSSDLDPESTSNFRAWKKSIMILWKQVASHRYASLFLQPVTDDIAPNYSTVVYRAMDLATLKKNLETGVVRTTSEFQRDLMLMFQNALMYNNREHDVYKMAEEMQKDVMDQVAQFLATQLMMETAQQSTPKGLRRSTLRKSALSEKVKVSESRSKRTAAIEGEAKFLKKKQPHE